MLEKIQCPVIVTNCYELKLLISFIYFITVPLILYISQTVIKLHEKIQRQNSEIHKILARTKNFKVIFID